MIWRSSNSAAVSRSRERSGPRSISAGRSSSISMSVCIVASCFEIRASSACSVRFCLRFGPEISSMLSSTPSSDPYCLQQLGGGLLADPGNARDVVGGVALEPDQVGDQLRLDAVALDDAVAVVDLRVGDAARGRHHPDPVADQLIGVAVAGHDHHRDLALAGLPDHRRDHVVGLPALDP